MYDIYLFLHLQTWLYLVLCYLWESKHLHKPINSSVIFKLLTCSVSQKTPVSVLYNCYTCSEFYSTIIWYFQHKLCMACMWVLIKSYRSFHSLWYDYPCRNMMDSETVLLRTIFQNTSCMHILTKHDGSSVSVQVHLGLSCFCC